MINAINIHKINNNMFSLSKSSRIGLGVLGGVVLLFAFIAPGNVFGEEATTGGSDLTKPILSLAAAIAIAGGLIGTGNAQQGIGAAGMGIIAEKPEKFGQVLFFFVIPETLWIIGFVLGIILLLGIL
jgi:V/A-type H+-transporting ATPase subunit K